VSVRVLVVDDEELVRTGFRLVLDREPDLAVVGEAADGAAATALAAQLAPDVVLMDIRMPELDGLEATRRIVATTDARVVMLTTFDEDAYVYDALRAGASGFLLKYAPAEDLVRAIRVVAAGEAMLAPTVTRRLLTSFARGPADADAAARVASLTAREREVLRLIARGLSNTEIADELIISRATVKTHVANLLDKLVLRDRVQAVALAYRSGLMQDAR
jgi:DNA-binding NarL/FixJ family response regulator